MNADLLHATDAACTCRDCKTVVSPAAYLADLLDYVVRHVVRVEVEDPPFGPSTEYHISLDELTTLLHRPFDALPASTCESTVDTELQVRLCIEVLRRTLSRPLPADEEEALSAAEAEYRRAAYETFLERIGTSATELRTARPDADERERLAERLGIAETHLYGEYPRSFDDVPRLHLDRDEVTEDRLEALFGLVTTEPPPDDVPADPGTSLFEEWRLEYLRETWTEKDFPVDPYSADADPSERLPVVDPDVVGPDDFRNPDPGTSPAFDLWWDRRVWVDDQLRGLKALGRESDGGPDFDAMFDLMVTGESEGEDIEYDGVVHRPWDGGPAPAEFQSLHETLTEADDERIAEARDAVERLGLTVEEFVRLVEIQRKDERHRLDSRYDALTDGELRDVYSILVQAQKRELYPVWIDEETAAGVLLGPETFWMALREPEEGSWPPERGEDVPLVDPERVEVADLPARTTSPRAHELWQTRRTALETKRDDVRTARETGGFDAMLHEAYGDPPDPETWDTVDSWENPGEWDEYLDARRDQLDGEDPTVVENARENVEAVLEMSQGEFTHLLEMRAKSDASSDREPPSETEWTELYATLTSKWKLKERYAAWRTNDFADEPSGENDLPYWELVKARLPSWRGPAGTRRNWQRALETRSSPPVVDPDILGSREFIDRSPGGDAFSLRTDRMNWLRDELGRIEALGAGPDRDRLDAKLTDVVGVSFDEFVDLEARRAESDAFGKRLDQLCLARREYGYLRRMVELIESEAPLSDDQWRNVDNILVQVSKRRRFGEWRRDERTRRPTTYLAPAVFEPGADVNVFPEEDDDPGRWRVDRERRQDWEEVLEARDDQRASLAESVEETVSTVEERTLPPLRDALVAAIPWRMLPSRSSEFEDKAAWFTDRFFVDAAADGCQETTRVSQALVTLQSFVRAVRSGEGLPLAEGGRYVLDDDQFEDRWQWLESYTSWKAAVSTFLYPENVLLPSLRKRRNRTPAFESLTRNLSSTSTLSPERACEEAGKYAAYFEDVSDLDVEATCWAKTRITRGGDCDVTEVEERYRFYMFGEADIAGEPESENSDRTVYWSTYDPTEERLSLWQPVDEPRQPGRAVLGAFPYRDSIYLLMKKLGETDGESDEEDSDSKLVYRKYDLQNDEWKGETEIELPDEVDLSSSRSEKYTAVPVQGNGARAGEDPPPGFLVVYTGFSEGPGPGYDTYLEWIELDADEEQWIHKGTFTDRVESGESGPVPRDIRAACKTDEGIVYFKEDGRYKPYSIVATVYPLNEYGNPTVEDGPVTEITLGSGDWRGAFQWEATDTVYVFWAGEPDGGYPYFEPNVYYEALEIGRTAVTRQLGSWFPLFGAYTTEQAPYSFFHFRSEGSLLDSIATHCGFNRDDDLERMSIVSTNHDYFSGGEFSYKQAFGRGTDDRLSPVGLESVTPRVPWDDDHELTSIPDSPPPDRGEGDGLQELREDTYRLNEWETKSLSNTNLNYIKEAYYFVPLSIALRLQRSGEYEAALGWYRTIYDFRKGGIRGSGMFYPGLMREGILSSETERIEWLRHPESDEDWLLDPLDVHAVASYRTAASPYTRFTKFSLVRCLLDYADQEFATDTKESLAHARTMYTTAVDLLDEVESSYFWTDSREEAHDVDVVEPCEELALDVTSEFRGAWRDEPAEPAEDLRIDGDLPVLTIGTTKYTFDDLGVEVHEAAAAADEYQRIAREVGPGVEQLGESLAEIESFTGRTEAFNAVTEVLTDDHDRQLSVRVQEAIDVADAAVEQDGGAATYGEVLTGGSDSTATDSVLLRDESVADLMALAAESAKRRFDRSASVASNEPVTDGGEGSEVEHLPDEHVHSHVSIAFEGFCVPPNPVLQRLRSRGETNLYKLRNCLNIAGIRRRVEPYSAPTDVESSLPTIQDGQLAFPGSRTLDPTPYRYGTLIDRAKELVDHAQQVESRLLSALEARDREAYKRLQAKQDKRLAEAGVRLQTLRMRKAQDRVTLSRLQRAKARIRHEHYARLLASGLLREERRALEMMNETVTWHKAAQGAIASAMAESAVMKAFGMGGGSTAALGAQLFSSRAAMTSTEASILRTKASYRRRRQQWQLQESLARQEMDIGDQQVVVAEDRAAVVGQEREIAELKHEHAGEVLEFLDERQFTTTELYQWMSRILEDVYRYFLQQATAMARLAQRQLAFQRQETPRSIVQADYWELPSQGQSASPDGDSPERHGLTSSARLLRDIYKLDQYAFETDERKHQLTKTISLAREYPYAFERFRETGVLTFDTPMELFNRDFPGHYLRLIKRVRTSVLALVPPTEGIKATLSTTGISRVVTGDELFQTRVVRRNPESVALTSPQDATGLFELQPRSEPEKRLPFESMGVDTRWEFEMPKAANQFDYDTIADVLLTIEYTALEDYGYRQQVIDELDAERSADRAFSFREEFADQWFDLNNADPDADTISVSFSTRREDFLPNVENLMTEHLLVYFVGAEDGETAERASRMEAELAFTGEDTAGTVSAASAPVEGVISTRSGSGGSWLSLTGNEPVGEWEITLPNTPQVRSLLEDEEIEDILFVVTYEGRTPEWPE